MTEGPQAEVVLRLDNITKRFGALTANDHISLTLRRGEIVALLGENGAGKTTLMNILFGHYTADEGTVTAFGTPLPPGQPRAALESGIGMVHQHFTLAENLSVLDNILLGTAPLWRATQDRRAARKRLARLSEDYGLAVHPDVRISRLSVGERQRVEILKALWRDAKILILDEPTAVLTPQESDALFATLRRATAHGLSIIFISHKLHEVMAAATRVTVLRHGRVVGETATADTSRDALAAMMVGGSVASPRLTPRAPGPDLLTLRDVSTATLNHVTLSLPAGQITGVAGVAGNGQSALADLISGLDTPASGTMTVTDAPVTHWSPQDALSRGIARIPEDRHATGTIADMDLTENAMLEGYRTAPFSRRGWLDRRAARRHTEALIRDYDVRCPGPDTRIRLLSGGNMQKLILGRALEAGPRIILANQPVRGLDVGAVAYVQSRLIAARDTGAAVLLISEDLDEVMELSDRIHVISRGRLSPAFARGTMTAPDLGRWMAGTGFEDPHAA